MAVRREDEFLHGEDAQRILKMEDDIGRLLASPGWRALAGVGKSQATLRQEVLLSWRPRPEGPSDDFLKGVIFGIELLLKTPGAIMEQAQELHAQRAKELDDASE